MSCHDCGIASWQPCICTDEGAGRADREAELREATSIDEQARRVAIQHAIADRADALLHGVDPTLRPLTPADWITDLASDLGDVATDVRVNSGADLEASLVRLAADVQLWLEQIVREAAR